MPSYGYREHTDPPKFLRFLKHRKLMIMVGSLLLVVLLITFSNKGLLRRVLLEAEVGEKTDRLRELRVEIDSLKRVQAMLQSDKATIEHVAREAHGMIKPGETVYRIRPAGAKGE